MSTLPRIEISEGPGDVYHVVVRDRGQRTSHRVRVTDEDALRYGRGAPGGVVLEAAMSFLLDREPPESILPEFSLSDIERYFPEFPEKIGEYLFG